MLQLEFGLRIGSYYALSDMNRRLDERRLDERRLDAHWETDWYWIPDTD